MGNPEAVMRIRSVVSVNYPRKFFFINRSHRWITNLRGILSGELSGAYRDWADANGWGSHRVLAAMSEMHVHIDPDTVNVQAAPVGSCG